MGQVLIEIQIPLWIHVRNASMIRNWPSQFHINCVHTSARHSTLHFLRISVVQVYQLSFANFPHKSRLAGVLRKFPYKRFIELLDCRRGETKDVCRDRKETFDVPVETLGCVDCLVSFQRYGHRRGLHFSLGKYDFLSSYVWSYRSKKLAPPKGINDNKIRV
jgi:hypothetical protein